MYIFYTLIENLDGGGTFIISDYIIVEYGSTKITFLTD